jgi:hypothetical protein
MQKLFNKGTGEAATRSKARVKRQPARCNFEPSKQELFAIYGTYCCTPIRETLQHLLPSSVSGCIGGGNGGGSNPNLWKCSACFASAGGGATGGGWGP